MKLNFKMPTDYEVHECNAYRTGDWIIYQCPKCPGYERRLNWRTGETKARHVRKDISHSGSYFPAEYKEIFENVN